jgi:hypothetical protein
MKPTVSSLVEAPAVILHFYGPWEKSSLFEMRCWREQIVDARVFRSSTFWRMNMRKSIFAIALVGIIATPAFADEVGVHVGPVGAGVTVGESHDRNWDRDHSTTVIKEREPTDRTTVIKKEDADGTRSKTIIHDNN